MANNYNTSLQNINIDLQEILDTINELPEANNGVELPELTNAGTSTDLLSGKQLIDGNGQIIEGAIPTKTSYDITVSGATVTVPTGYYDVEATKSVSAATQATPSISVSTSGLITASATQSAGYVSAGTKSATKQLTTKAATTITPSTSSQTAVAANVYTTGAITVAAIPSKYKDVSSVTAGAGDVLTGKKIVNSSGTVVTGTMANNGALTKTMDGVNTKSVSIPAGYTSGGTVSLDNTIDNEVTEQLGLLDQLQGIIEGLPNAEGGGAVVKLQDKTVKENGTYTADSGYDGLGTVVVDVVSGESSDLWNQILNRSFTSVQHATATTVGDCAFAYCNNLTKVSFPAVTKLNFEAFKSCTKLSSVSFPAVASIDTNVFHGCNKLSNVNFPLLRDIGMQAFMNCSKLSSVHFPVLSKIGYGAFWNCESLNTANFPKVQQIGNYAFSNCYNLKSLYLTGSSVCALTNSTAFASTPIGGYSASAGTYGSIYVPTSLVDAYKSATNWTYFSSRFVAFDEGSDLGGEG